MKKLSIISLALIAFNASAGLSDSLYSTIDECNSHDGYVETSNCFLEKSKTLDRKFKGKKIFEVVSACDENYVEIEDESVCMSDALFQIAKDANSKNMELKR